MSHKITARELWPGPAGQFTRHVSAMTRESMKAPVELLFSSAVLLYSIVLNSGGVR
jgi:hypothetical protein